MTAQWTTKSQARMNDSKNSLVLAIDQGTTSSRVIAYDRLSREQELVCVHSYQLEHEQIHEKPGWVEHSPLEIVRNIERCLEKVLEAIMNDSNYEYLDLNEMSAIPVGITNQRETVVAWDSVTKEPLMNAIVWCDVRTSEICQRFSENEKKIVLEKCGMPISTYFGCSKMIWMLENCSAVKEAKERGTLRFGTVDSWIIEKLASSGDSFCHHYTDVTNASRYLLMNVETLDWDEELLELFGIERIWLPKIISSAEAIRSDNGKNGRIYVCGVLGDQHASALGHRLREGDSKNTYGTGCFAMRNTGDKITRSNRGILTTVCWKLGKEAKTEYALEGAVAVGGECIRWLKEDIELIEKTSDIELFAKKVDNAAGVTFVPAFGGLFAPHWRSDSRGVIVGLTRYVKKAHICRAALEAICYQSAEVLEAMALDCNENHAIAREGFLRADGGASANATLMQIQADVLGATVCVPKNIETTALGAALAAGIGAGYWTAEDVLGGEQENTSSRYANTYENNSNDDDRIKGRSRWDDALKRTYGLDKFCNL